MRSKNFVGMKCSIAGALEQIGDGWAILILRDLGFGLSKYEELRRSSGVTNATLSDRLRRLKKYELVTRRRYQRSPDRYEYLLTPKGRDALLVTYALLQVGDKWKAAGRGGPPVAFVNKQTGASVRLGFIDEQSGSVLRSSDLKAQPGPGADDLAIWRLAQRERLPT
jgi:DNA-binding HxlR family transcriptional regulator